MSCGDGCSHYWCPCCATVHLLACGHSYAVSACTARYVLARCAMGVHSLRSFTCSFAHAHSLIKHALCACGVMLLRSIPLKRACVQALDKVCATRTRCGLPSGDPIERACAPVRESRNCCRGIALLNSCSPFGTVGSVTINSVVKWPLCNWASVKPCRCPISHCKVRPEQRVESRVHMPGCVPCYAHVVEHACSLWCACSL